MKKIALFAAFAIVIAIAFVTVKNRTSSPVLAEESTEEVIEVSVNANITNLIKQPESEIQTIAAEPVQTITDYQLVLDDTVEKTKDGN